jgi:hypothetical protein
VLVVIATGDDAVSVRTAAALASLPVAWLAYRFFETPLRFSSLLARSRPQTFVVGAVATVFVLVVAGLVYRTAPNLTTVAAAADERSAGTTVPGLELPSGLPLDDRVAFAVNLYRERSDTSCPKDALKTPAGDDYCVGGDLKGTRTVMLLGDSHAGQWRHVLETIAKERGVKLLIRQHNGCAPFPILFHVEGARADDKAKVCTAQQEGDRRVFDALAPEAVIVASATVGRATILDANGAIIDDEAEQRAVWHTAVGDLLDDLTDRGIEVGWIFDEPALPFDASQCVLAEQSVDACVPDLTTAMAISGPLLEVEREELTERGITATFDTGDVICDDQRCQLEIDSTLVYVDAHHLTDAFAFEQKARLEPLFDQLLGP